LHLAGVIRRVCQRGRSVRVGGVDGRIERLKRIERAVGRHRSALLGAGPRVAQRARGVKAGVRGGACSRGGGASTLGAQTSRVGFASRAWSPNRSRTKRAVAGRLGHLALSERNRPAGAGAPLVPLGGCSLAVVACSHSSFAGTFTTHPGSSARPPRSV